MSNTVSHQRQLLSLIVVAGLALVVWQLARWNRSPRPYKYDADRSAVVNLSRVREIDLTLNGKPLLNETHDVRLDQTCRLEGRLRLQPEAIPLGLHVVSLKRVIRPAGSTEAEWNRRQSSREWNLRVPNPPRVEDTEVLRSSTFSPGDHEMRLFLAIRDAEGSLGDQLDYLGTAKLSVSRL